MNLHYRDSNNPRARVDRAQPAGLGVTRRPSRPEWDRSDRGEVTLEATGGAGGTGSTDDLARPGTLYRDLVDAARVGLLQFDGDGRAVFANRWWRELTGIDDEPPIDGQTLLAITHPDDRDRQVEQWIAMREEGARYSTTVRLRHPSGGWRWVDIEFDRLEDSDPTDPRFVATFADVTDRVETEAAARADEQRTRTVLDSLHEGLVIHDRSGRIVTANRAAVELAGVDLLSVDDARTWLGWQWFDEEGRPLDFEDFPAARTFATGHADTDRIVGFRPPGRDRVWVQMNARPLGDDEDTLVVVSFRDITQRKRAADALRESEERYRILVEQAPVGHVLTDMRGTLVQANDVFAGLVGRTPEGLVGTTPAQLIHPDDLEATVLLLDTLRTNDADRIDTEVRLVRSDGSTTWVAANAAVVRSGDGEPLFIQVTVSDIGERLEAERRIQDSEQRYRAMVDSLHDGLLIHDGERLSAANDSAARILGVTLDELLEDPGLYFDLEPLDLEGRPIPVEERPAIKAWTEQRPIDDFIEQVTLRDGTRRWLSVNTRPLLDEHDETRALIISFTDVTARKEASDRLRESEERYRQLSASSPLGQIVSSLDGTVLEANQAFAEIIGATPEELVGLSPEDLVHPADLETFLARGQGLAESEQEQFALETRLRRHDDGSEVWAIVNTTLLRDANGELSFYLSIVEDVTERRRTAEQTKRLASIVETTSDLVGMIDFESGRLLYLNQAAREILGYIDADVTRVHVRRLYTEDITRLFRGAIETAIRNGGSWSGEVDMQRADGSVIKVWQNLSGEVGADGRIHTISSVGRDVTERKQLEDRLAHRATHDPLTDLPNRTLLLEHLEVALARARRKSNHVALHFLDLDRFKRTNDSLGHEAGDALLVAVAERIQEVLRPTDTLSRMGGDEFVILSEDVSDENHAIGITQRVTANIAAKPFYVGGTRIDMTVSAGIAIDTDPDTHAESLLRDADAAMYRAKDRGRARHELFDESMRRRSAHRLQLADELSEALSRGDIIVHYQPIVDLASGSVEGVEALARWKHADRGLLPPYEFIGLAEETGLIVGLGLEVLTLAADQARRWEVELGAGAPRVHINLSARQLTHSSLPSVVAGVLEQSLIEPDRLCLEVTESVLMEDAPKAIATLEALKHLGVHLAIDDFGTGYSSLAYLRRFPVDVLKVDRSFVDGLGPDPHDSTIVAAIVSLAHTLGLTCVAEGVETGEQLMGLRSLGCEMAQGFYFARPVQPEDLRPVFGSSFDLASLEPTSS